MTRLLARRWYVMATRGVAAAAFGVLALFWPAITAGVLAVLFGAYVLTDAVLALGTALGDSDREDRRILGLEGLLDVIAGGVALVWRDITPRGLLYVIAAWAIGTGVTELLAAYRLRRDTGGDPVPAASGIASVLTGLVLALRSDAPTLAVSWLIGAYALAFGSMLVTLALRLRTAERARLDAAAVDGAAAEVTTSTGTETSTDMGTDMGTGMGTDRESV